MQQKKIIKHLPYFLWLYVPVNNYQVMLGRKNLLIDMYLQLDVPPRSIGGPVGVGVSEGRLGFTGVRAFWVVPCSSPIARKELPRPHTSRLMPPRASRPAAVALVRPWACAC